MPMILITAANGHLGRLVAQALVARTHPVTDVVLTARDPGKLSDLQSAGFRIARADYDDPASLTMVGGADKLLFISSPELDHNKRMSQHLAVVRAAALAEVNHIVYTSVLGVDAVVGGVYAAHQMTETAIRESGVPYTFL